ncbi:MAG: sialate O-acetylesterase [Fuerstiella sp.]
MKCTRVSTVFLSILTALLSLSAVNADVRLPAVLDSHMVIQRDQPVRIWGWADAEERVTVTLGSESQTVTAGDDGRWLVAMKAQKADGIARQISVAGKNEVVLEDVLVGEVWIGSGQSNMEWQLKNTDGAAEAIAAADHPQIRLFHVPKVNQKQPADDVKADWRVCTPSNVPAFSAVLYYFGKQLHQELNVPVGLINSSWGGSPIEPWTIKGDQSGGMYNGMIAPLTNVAVRGTIWYQGETNVIQKNGLSYFDKMQDLIQGWRTAFGNDRMAFYFVQIAPWSGRYEPGQLPALWEAQVASLKIPHTGMAVTTDLVDNMADIHPRNKRDVGYRLSLWALTKLYGRKGLVYSGPLYESMKVDGNSIRLTFAHTGDGLKSSDGKALTEFQIAGDDGRFVDANAEIDRHSVVVSAETVEKPTQVRFAWHKVCQPNLVNSAGLPASPFQTDNWQGGTGLE